MLSRFRWAARLALFTLFVLPMVACERVPLLAPSGSTLTLTSPTTALPINGTTPIGVQVIEPSGTPPHSGTHVTFTTTLGTLFPTEVETDSSGQAIVQFRAGTASGTATISAISGGASVAATGVLKILVGTAAVGKVVINASPSLVPSLGGSSTITTQVYDVNGNALASAPVSFSTTAGVLSSTLAVTDGNGSAQVVLNTSTQAVVTASVGSTAPPTTGGGGTGGGTPTPSASGTASASVTVGIAAAPGLVITPPTTASVGLPASFTFAVTVPATNGSAIKNVLVNWGDGSTQDLGVLTGSAVVSHIFRSAGVFVVTATVTDAFGNTVPVTTSVSVSAPALSLVISLPAGSLPGKGVPTSFTFAPTVPTGDSVKNVSVDWGDLTAVLDLGAVTGSVTVQHVFVSAGSYTIKGTLTDAFGNSVTSSTPVTVVDTASPTIIITPPTVPAIVTYPYTANFTVQITAPSGVTISSATIDFGDGVHTQNLGGLNGTATVSSPYAAAGTYIVVVSAKDTLGRTTQGSVTIKLP